MAISKQEMHKKTVNKTLSQLHQVEQNKKLTTSISSFLPTVCKNIDIPKNKKVHVESNLLPKVTLHSTSQDSSFHSS